MIIVSLIIASVFLVPGVVSARDGKGAAHYYSLAGESCAKMVEDVSKYKEAEVGYKMYLDGFATGYNLGRGGKEDFWGKTDNLSRYKFLYKYCENNPLDLVAEAINKIILKYNDSLW